ncbi:MAG: 4-hydroxythreonine-4-phosphate dehydrogenase PdxA [Armatimonadota bacterium]|nr:MAG: 4-hydroxythreonine-4-phosphate dehydrogenase PdxA [Armatimonadota bacterium]
MSDPLGVGPEVILKALRDERVRRACLPLVIGDAEVLRAVRQTVPSAPEIRSVAAPSDVTGEVNAIAVLDLANARGIDLGKRGPTAAAGRAAGEAINRAASMAMAGDVDAIVTAPINKEAMRLAGYEKTGHTEMLAELTGARDVAMLLIWENMRVAHATTHLALREVPEAITRERVLRTIRLTDDTMKRLGIEQSRIAVAGLNPHAGEAGLFGEEERAEIAPAVADARAYGINAAGPLPPDTVFAQMRGGLYDAVVAMYHDQGHIAIKTLSFRPGTDERSASMSGVNVTMGLPIIRTSVDHGTAFDIAGKGIASEQSMVEAILLAAHMAIAA